ncbi:helix-turn-helix domain-containing protein [Roseomonas sp. CAU 1739]|uniref:helix-turn-helix domain-containing protein n=1 Tax=Roseomonas sp. CAU 1739 TaxID=3140364 RepID=UPI00325AF2C7
MPKKIPLTPATGAAFAYAKLPRLIPIALIAAHLSRSTRSVRWYIDDGKLPAVELNGRLLVRPEELAAFIARHERRDDD